MSKCQKLRHSLSTWIDLIDVIYLFPGLITLDEMRAKQEVVIQQREQQLATSEKACLSVAEKKEQKGKKNKSVKVLHSVHQCSEIYLTLQNVHFLYLH